MRRIAGSGTICEIKKRWKTLMEECWTKSKVVGPKVTLLHRWFLRFLNCTNGIKLPKDSHHENKSHVVHKIRASEHPELIMVVGERDKSVNQSDVNK